ncbi:hypothetical protein J3458_000935 [Metarhizium acridum]|uniref:uncharacterized protein n=1 Tax=Metarhizium acridum TaxID=92637 RepID=UPI001C6B4F6E|nr:hypothetical protein J3458_000935 [Metarhizium acridum]
MGPKVSSRLWMFLPFHQKAPASQSKTSTTSPRSPNQGVTWARGTLSFVLSSLPPATWPVAVAVAVYGYWDPLSGSIRDISSSSDRLLSTPRLH